jgi:hypothetical protein
MFQFFDPQKTISKGKGGALPHWRQEGVLYFVTFRLADSLPQAKLRLLRNEKEAWFAQYPKPWSAELQASFQEHFTARIHQWLDAGYGSELLGTPPARTLVEHTLLHFAGLRYELDRFVVASNHVHALVSPRPPFSLSQVIKSWKSYTARKLLALPKGQELSTAPTVWQKESWDHIVRSPASLERFRAYISSH